MIAYAPKPLWWDVAIDSPFSIPRRNLIVSLAQIEDDMSSARGGFWYIISLGYRFPSVASNSKIMYLLQPKEKKKSRSRSCLFLSAEVTLTLLIAVMQRLIHSAPMAFPPPRSIIVINHYMFPPFFSAMVYNSRTYLHLPGDGIKHDPDMDWIGNGQHSTIVPLRVTFNGVTRYIGEIL